MCLSAVSVGKVGPSQSNFMNKLKNRGILVRVGATKKGKWLIDLGRKAGGEESI